MRLAVTHGVDLLALGAIFGTTMQVLPVLVGVIAALLASFKYGLEIYDWFAQRRKRLAARVADDSDVQIHD